MTKNATATPSQSTSDERDEVAINAVRQRTDLAPLCRELAKSLWLYPRTLRSDTTRTLAHGGHPLALATLDDAEIIEAQFCRVRELASANDITLGELMREVDLLDVLDVANEPLRKKLRGHLDALADAANGKASATTAPPESSPASKLAPHWYSFEPDYRSCEVLGQRYWMKKEQLRVVAKALDESRFKRMKKVDAEALLLQQFPLKPRVAKIPPTKETPASEPAKPKVQALTEAEDAEMVKLLYEERNKHLKSINFTDDKLNRLIVLQDRLDDWMKAGAGENDEEEPTSNATNGEPAGATLKRKLFQKRSRVNGEDVWETDPLFGLLFAFDGEYLIIRDKPPPAQNATVS